MSQSRLRTQLSGLCGLGLGWDLAGGGRAPRTEALGMQGPSECLAGVGEDRQDCVHVQMHPNEEERKEKQATIGKSYGVVSCILRAPR